ncbi:hypothetical protein B0H16DRAFT_1480627 [Mycena metata]|uniref:Uncharacterized protein n=1 Tax=Mycena metata TaxID=1033252 RepID=A0AAD7H3N1_9AGAR|nr:hypothetical protein B0H16DRAFT_1480627 [Mycena metata]
MEEERHKGKEESEEETQARAGVGVDDLPTKPGRAGVVACARSDTPVRVCTWSTQGWGFMYTCARCSAQGWRQERAPMYTKEGDLGGVGVSMLWARRNDFQNIPQEVEMVNKLEDTCPYDRDARVWCGHGGGRMREGKYPRWESRVWFIDRKLKSWKLFGHRTMWYFEGGIFAPWTGHDGATRVLEGYVIGPRDDRSDVQKLVDGLSGFKPYVKFEPARNTREDLGTARESQTTARNNGFEDFKIKKG